MANQGQASPYSAVFVKAPVIQPQRMSSYAGGCSSGPIGGGLAASSPAAAVRSGANAVLSHASMAVGVASGAVLITTRISLSVTASKYDGGGS